MYKILYQYLIFNEQLSLPGVGTISLQRTPARLDIANKVYLAPGYNFVMDSSNDKPSKKLFDWLSDSLQISEWEAIRRVNEFSFDLKNKIASTGEVNWDHVGVLHRNETGNIVLDSLTIVSEAEGPVVAEKVIRENVQHTMLVGERERTSSEMEMLLLESGGKKKKDWGWMISIILVIILVMFIGIYFSEKGLKPSSAGNQGKVKVESK